MKRETVIVLSCLLLAMTPLACGNRSGSYESFRQSMLKKLPELDFSEVSEFVSLDNAEVVLDASSGSGANLDLTLTVLKDFGDQQLVLQIYRAQAVPFGPPVPAPDPVDGKISWTIQNVDTWQTQGKGVFRLIEPAG